MEDRTISQHDHLARLLYRECHYPEGRNSGQKMRQSMMRQVALSVAFLVIGIAMASWITRTPAIRDALGASTEQMGWVLFGLSVGSMSGILAASPLVSHYGARLIAITGITCVVSGLGMIGVSVLLGNKSVATAGFGSIGFGIGLSEIAINIDGEELERLTAQPLLHQLHGFYSLGTIIGALVGFGFTWLEVPVPWHLAITGTIGGIAALYFSRFISRDVGRTNQSTQTPDTQSSSGLPALLRERRLFLIGLVILGMALAEGAANDWLPLLMVDGYGYDQASGSLIYFAFALSMAIGRFCGGYFLNRFGRALVMRGCAVLCALGIGIVSVGTSAVAGGVGVLLWGLGASLGFPVTISAAGQSGANPAARVKIVATTGYIAFLVGPPLLGFIGQHYGLRVAMLVVLSLAAAAVIAAPAVGPSRKSNAKGEAYLEGE